MAEHVLARELLVDVDEVALEDVEAAWQRLAAPGHRKIVVRPRRVS
jgi:hypothetical protein